MGVSISIVLPDQLAMSTVPRKTYYKTAVALFVLLGLTLGVSYLALGPFGPVAAMTVAIIKAVLIVLFFMHVRYQTHMIWVLAVAGTVWLLILFGLTFSDYLTRGWLPLTTWGV